MSDGFGSVELGWCDGELVITRADPKIRVGATLDGDILKLSDSTGRTVIYRIGEKVQDSLAYYAEWPD